MSRRCEFSQIIWEFEILRVAGHNLLGNAEIFCRKWQVSKHLVGKYEHILVLNEDPSNLAKVFVRTIDGKHAPFHFHPLLSSNCYLHASTNGH